MIHQTHDAAFINRVANSPAVKPFMRADGQPIDFSPAVGRDALFVVVLTDGDDAVAAFEMTEAEPERRWQAHTMFGERCRGQKAVRTGREMVDFMIPRCADVLWGATPLSNRAARWFNRQIGAKPIGLDEYEVDGPVEIFEIRKPS